MNGARVVIVMRDKAITVDDTNPDEWKPLVDRWQEWMDTHAGNPGATITMSGKSVDVDYRDIIRIDISGADR